MVSQFGSAIGMVALPVIAVVVLQATEWQVSLLAGIAALTTACVAFPLGHRVEHRRKRPVMIGCDLLRGLCVASIPLAWALGLLTFTHLCVVAAVNAVGTVAFTAASQSHLKSLVSPSKLIDANSRLESTRWFSISLGPSVAGALIAGLTAVGSLTANTVGFLASAVAIRSICAPEPDPPEQKKDASKRSELFAGLSFVWGHPSLRRLLINWTMFTGAYSLAAPLTAVFYMRDLGVQPVRVRSPHMRPFPGRTGGGTPRAGSGQAFGRAEHPVVGLTAPRTLVLSHPFGGSRNPRAVDVRGGFQARARIRRNGQFIDGRVSAVGNAESSDVSCGHPLVLCHCRVPTTVHHAEGNHRQRNGRAHCAPHRGRTHVSGRSTAATAIGTGNSTKPSCGDGMRNSRSHDSSTTVISQAPRSGANPAAHSRVRP